MAEQRDATHPPTPLNQDSVTAALLEITADLDKAQVLQNMLPAWLTTTTDQVRQALWDTYDASQSARDNAARLLERVIPLRQFCAELLQAWLAAKGHSGLDIEHDVLELPATYVVIGSVVDAPRTETRDGVQYSLLQAAMQNFTPDDVPLAAVIRRAADRTPVPTLSAQTFVGYCRDLDLGEAYQRHLREVFNLPASAQEVSVDAVNNPAVATVGQTMCMSMLIDLHIAFAKGDIGQAAYTVLLALIEADRPARSLTHLQFNGRALTWQGLQIDQTSLWGVLVFSQADSEGFSDGPLLVYMPGEPVRPWFEYPSLAGFKTYLTLKLQVASYRRSFMRYLDESQRFGFFQRFDQSKTLERIVPMPVTANLSWFFFAALTCKLQRDAEVLAVPKAQVDAARQQQRLNHYLEAGLTVLNLAGLVVPVLGQLMTGVAIGQMLAEVFEGVEDWSQGETSEALEHVVNVAQSLASMALFAAGVKTVARVFKATRTSAASFFDKMEAVAQPDASPRLWRRSLTPYRQSVDVDAQTSANVRGIYQLGGQSYVKIDGALYGVVFDADAGHWTVRHPLRDNAYRPPVSHNRQGGWRFTFEQADDWRDECHLLARLDPSVASFPQEQLKGVAAITGITLPRLRFLFRENRPLPMRLRDAVIRVRHNQQVRDLVWQLEHQPRPDASTAYTQLLALPLMPGWPKGRFFEVLDSRGELIERYPDTAPFDYEDLSIHITEQQLNDGEVMSTLLEMLEPDEVRALLGAEVEPEVREAALSRRLLASLKRTHRQVYEQLYEQDEGLTHTDYGLLKRHYPRLPNRLAWELLTGTSTLHRWQLRDTRRVPLGLAEHARAALEQLEQDQALIGLLLPELATEFTSRVAIGLLTRVPGWPNDVQVQLRADSLTGRLLGQSGSATATMRRIVVSTDSGFQAFDEQGQALGELATGDEGLYRAVLDTLSPAQRQALGLSGDYLRYALRAEAESGRTPVSRFLYPERPVPEPSTLCPVAAQVDPGQHPSALVRKVRHLYPLFTDGQIAAFLDKQGNDHLSRARAVQALEREFDALHRALKVWRRDRTTLSGLPRSVDDYRLSRYYATQRIEGAWKQMLFEPDAHGSAVSTLDLDGMVVGPLPTLPAEVNFAHVRQLSLNHMALDDDVAYFLKHFKGLETLELQGNRVSRIPDVLLLMPELKRLYLSDNRLQMTEYNRAKLASMNRLQLLNLNNNPLLDPPAIGRLFDLRGLFLRDCRLKDLPVELTKLPYLDYVDLRGNDIATLPQWLSELPDRLGKTLNLRLNPLNSTSRLLLAGYRKRTGIGMGYLEDDIARLDERRARALWLDDSDPGFSARQATWTALNDERGSDGLFKLLAELGGTADARQVHEDLDRRVWRVLEAAATDADLRTEIFERASTPLNCDDAAALSFANLEVLAEVREVSRSVEGGVLTAKPLLRLARGLFRLDQLELYARRHSAEHPSADPLEVSLAFRTGLVDRFYLPGQPRHMRFARLGGVTTQTMTTAAHQLRAAELSPALLNFLIELPLWSGYLKKTYRRQFERLSEPFEQRMHTVFDQSLTLDDADYRAQMEQILREQAVAEKAEIQRLTEEALRLDALEVCQAPLS
ncbi:NEL-type E3 ubiquitin ligase domain-containing protein [Pseudomonas rhodesiae]|uniref:NEL-type E3 ubiquitin ligase domain-containing protein n=1 Tax=Pseudomonas rhodesiae TaxID=76760 RepID=UPI0032B267D6